MKIRFLVVLSMGLVAACSPGGPAGGDSESDVPPDVMVGDGPLGELEAVEFPCGDGICDPEAKETCKTCPADCNECADVCGDGQCTGEESCTDCPGDCGECCGNGKCEGEETCGDCPGDCGVCPPVCPNAKCEDGPEYGDEAESCVTCPADCGECDDVCGDDECAGAETCTDCPEDCGPCLPECPNGKCEDAPEFGEQAETCETCPDDCGICPDEDCGNGECQDEKESCKNCPEDCGQCPACPDGTCNGEETCETCPDDCCAPPSCGDGKLDAGEECDDENLEPDDGCDDVCKVEPAAAEPGAIIITEILKNPAFVDDSVGEWFELYNTTESDIDINAWEIKDLGVDKHRIFKAGGVVVPAETHVVLAKSGDPSVNGGFEPLYVYASFNLSNKDDEIILLSGSTEVDVVAYDNGETFPNDVGRSLSLDPDKYDFELNDLGESWCSGPLTFGKGDFGSPGDDNPSCSPVCGDGKCAKEEGCEACPEDCGVCPPKCNNQVCEMDKDVYGDAAENCSVCPADCGPCCPNGFCDYGEQCGTCPQDCGQCCPNGQCDNGESCITCPDDCGTCQPICGDQVCNGNETCESCAQDCGTCPAAGWCKLSGKAGDTVMCQLALAAENAASPKATGIQFKISWDNAKVGLDKLSCMAGGIDMCDQFNTLPTGHALSVVPPKAQWAGNVSAAIYYGNVPPKAITEAYLEGGKVVGNGYVLDLVFKIKQPIDAAAAVVPAFTDLKGTDAVANSLTVTMDAGLLVTSAGGVGPKCGDGQCNGTETCTTCPGDCGACPKCGDAKCDPGENCNTCPGDCGACCPNGACDYGETCSTCAADCGACPVCGDAKCNGTENCNTCPGDCGACCPNGKCDFGETCSSCVADCGACPVCGDGKCNGTETCTTCPGDCGACPPAGWCKLSGNNGATISCKLKLAAENASSPKATGIQFKLNYDNANVSLEKLSCMTGGLDMCDQFNALLSGHAIGVAPPKASWAGSLSVAIYYSNVPPKSITDAYMNGLVVVGNADVLDLVFKLKTNIPAQSPVTPLFSGLTATDAGANPLTMTFKDGLFTTAAAGAAPKCGDALCNGTETCSTCPGDCGACCPNGKNDFGETCSTCAADCGACPVCGDGKCNGTETCGTCPSDCGACPVCGDGKCNGTETCGTCPSDCGACPTGWCSVSGNAGTTVNCKLKIAATSNTSPKATGIQFKVGYDSTKVSLEKFSCLMGALDMCDQFNALLSGHTLSVAPPKGQWAGNVSVAIYYGQVPPKAITEAYLSGGVVTGSADVLDIVFKLTQTVSAGSPVQVNLTDMVGTDATANSLTVTLQNGVLVTSKP
ncbi:MAG: hypothetical protein FJ109_02940 [Deltaproteobacteria bacterium]|nr:hypothetical protein [Deltaproteobacteria bacterium]